MGVDGPHTPHVPMRASSQGTFALSSLAPIGSPYHSASNGSVGRGNPPPSLSPTMRSSAPGNKTMEFRAATPTAPPLPPPGPSGPLQAYQSTPVSLQIPNNNQQMGRLPSVDTPNRPSSAFVGLTSSYRVQVDDKIRHARPETPQEVRQHTTHVQALAFAKEPEMLADNVMLLKRERNALLSDKQLLLVNKRRLEAVLGKLLGLGGMGLGGLDDDDDFCGTPNGRARGGNPMKARMMKVLDDSRALDNKLSGSGGVAAGMTVAEAEAKLNELQDRLAKLTAERGHLVTRLEGELSYRRTQATAVTAGLQKKLTETQDENVKLHRKVDELQGHLEFQVGELQAKVASLTQALADAQQKLNGSTESSLEELKKQLAAAEQTVQQQAAKIAELEHLVVQRDNTISELTGKDSAIAKAAEEAAAKAAAEAAAAAAAAVLDAVMEEAEAAALEVAVEAAEEVAVLQAEADAAKAESDAIVQAMADAAAQGVAAAEAEEEAVYEAPMNSVREAAAEDAEATAEAVAGEAAAAEAFVQLMQALEEAKVSELDEAKAKAAEAEARAKAAEAKAQELSTHAEKALKAREEELSKERQEMEKLRSELEAALKASKAAAADKAQLTIKLQEVEGALRAKTARVEELEQKVMALERDILDLKALMSKRKGLC